MVEEEDEEATPLSKKRHKATVGNQGTPSKATKGKEPGSEVLQGMATLVRASPIKTSSPKGEPSTVNKGKASTSGSVPPTGINRLFGELVQILGEIRVDYEIKHSTLNQVASLVGGKANSLLPKTVANCIKNLDETRDLEDRIMK